MIYLKLFLSFLQIGLFSFGGGYAAMPLIQDQVVSQHGWLTMTEFTDLITISQMTPGPIAVNAATFVGSKIAGVPGRESSSPAQEYDIFFPFPLRHFAILQPISSNLLHYNDHCLFKNLVV